MEHTHTNNLEHPIIRAHYTEVEHEQQEEQKEMARSPFIEANTIEATLEEINAQHIVPVFVKDNETVISHVDFIETTVAVVKQCYEQETILEPNIRLSHPIKGRVPEARYKAANELQEHEKTLYYERMAFLVEIPSIHDEIDGNKLSLCVGGVKAYNLDNLYSKKGTDEHFKIFIGFQNKVCTNLCVWTDGYSADIKVSNVGMLRALTRNLVERYSASCHLNQLARLSQYSLSESQFAHLVGKCRMYPHLPRLMQKDISPVLFGENQLGAVCRDYYKDQSFCRDADGNINLWRLYNLFTGANKSTYIDNFLDRAVNAYQFVESIRFALAGESHNWFLN